MNENESHHELADMLWLDYQYPLRETISVLLIDDDPDDIKLISNLSAKSKHIDFSIISSRSTTQAIDTLAAQHFDVIYIDYWMGAETSIAFVNQCARALKVPFVLITGFDTPDIRRLAFRAGAEAYLTKDEITTQAIESITLAVLRGRWAH